MLSPPSAVMILKIMMHMKQEQMPRHREQICGCQGEMGVGEKDWESGISRCKLLYMEWINHRVLLYSTGNYIQYPVISQNEVEYEKGYMYVFI